MKNICKQRAFVWHKVGSGGSVPGSAKECGGYCLIQNSVDETKLYYTQTFKPKEEIRIQFTPDKDGIYSFTGVWGSHPVGTKDADIIHGTD